MPFTGSCNDGTKDKAFKLQENQFRLDAMKKLVYDEIGETLEQAAQKSWGCFIP